MPLPHAVLVLQVHYTGTLDDGTEFDSSLEREPLEFEVGGGKVIPGFDDAVIGLAEGQTRKQLVPASRAYGKHTRTRCSCACKQRLLAIVPCCQGCATTAESCFCSHDM